MSLYELPQFNLPQFNLRRLGRKLKVKAKDFVLVVLIVFISAVFGFLASYLTYTYFYLNTMVDLFGQSIQLSGVRINSKQGQLPPQTTIPATSATPEETIVKIVETVSPAVVSIIISKDMPVFEQYYSDPFEEFFGPSPFRFRIPELRQKGVEKQEIGGGTGFIVSEDGLVLTNKHVVIDTAADYTVLTNDGRRFQAKVLAKDPFQDLAVLKIERTQAIGETGQFVLEPFPTVVLGNSDRLKIGQTVIAIGNALGEFRNTVSVGVVSGLGRTVTASGAGLTETLEDLVQTDAAINRGNSGGPLLDLKGKVIGVNVAMAEQAQNIGFAIPINKVKKAIEQVKTFGKIVQPYLGVYYCLIDETVQKQYGLSVNYGAWIGRDRFCAKFKKAVLPNTPAEKAGLQDGDIILEFQQEKITKKNSLAKIIQKYNPGDKVTLKILRGEEQKIIEVVLAERSD